MLYKAAGVQRGLPLRQASKRSCQWYCKAVLGSSRQQSAQQCNLLMSEPAGPDCASQTRSPCSVCARWSTAARGVQVGTALVTPALPAVLRWLLSGRPAQQDVAAEILSNAAEPAVLSAVAASPGAVDALAAMLQGRWESRYWAAACLAQLACCPATDTAVHEARPEHALFDACLPPYAPVVVSMPASTSRCHAATPQQMAW